MVNDLLKGIHHQEPSKRRISNSKVLATVLVSAFYFGSHLDNTRGFKKLSELLPGMLDKSRFSKWLHGLTELLCTSFLQVGQHLKDLAGAFMW
ncbi:MAG: hypothetical protein ICV84_06400 [Flavisolibacter sp.]|nr:hypothetical protein [Flavisolibacter sp.]